ALHYPCTHALAACANARIDWTHYVDGVYRMESVFQVYRTEFNQMPDEEMWPHTDGLRIGQTHTRGGTLRVDQSPQGCGMRWTRSSQGPESGAAYVGLLDTLGAIVLSLLLDHRF
ncbi:hypothetical protein PIB30_090701, partial [Stylosanthes scabra]|nr:hypothetical protein [Stylosanthes scabra]